MDASSLRSSKPNPDDYQVDGDGELDVSIIKEGDEDEYFGYSWDVEPHEYILMIPLTLRQEPNTADQFAEEIVTDLIAHHLYPGEKVGEYSILPAAEKEVTDESEAADSTSPGNDL